MLAVCRDLCWVLGLQNASRTAALGFSNKELQTCESCCAKAVRGPVLLEV